jgi:hypothetical protein
MWPILLLASVTASDVTTVRFKYDRQTTHLLWPYAKCVAHHNKGLPPGGVKAAFRFCHPARIGALKRADGARSRARVNAALADFETRYLRLALDSTDVR